MAHDEVNLGAAAGSFPATRLTLLEAARSSDESVRSVAFDGLVAGYWKPVYKYLRIRWRAKQQDAEDWTQEFFFRAMEKGFFDPFDPDKARFRTFLRTCLDRFVSNQRRNEGRLKRGGGVRLVGIDFETAEGEVVERELVGPDDVEAFFHREWVRNLFERAVDRLKSRCEAEGRQVRFEVFRRYDLEDPEPGRSRTYREVAEAMDLPVSQVTNFLHWSRSQFRSTVVELLAETTASREEAEAEARELFSGDDGAGRPGASQPGASRPGGGGGRRS